jgi:putative DNA primase/helicase
VSFDVIPEELKERDQWLMWDSSSDTPRRPHYRGDFGVSWTDPDDWHTFDDVVEAAAERESWGVGYVFAKGNEDYPRGIYGALDLDGCVEDGSPAEWLPDLSPFFDAGAYVEHSPSGEGIHIPLAGFEPPEWWSDVALSEHVGVETYGKKFFTFTGDTLRGSGDSVADTGEYVEEWLKAAYEEIEGERPWEPAASDEEDRETTTPVGASGNAEEIARAVDRLDARDVAEKTIVHRWNEGVASGDNKAFEPTWAGSDCSGSANIVDPDGWTDTGTDSGSGGPLTMALIDMNEISHSGASWDDAQGELWWDAVDHLRDLGFSIPEYVPRGRGSKAGDEPASDDAAPQTEGAEQDGSDPWETVGFYYGDGMPGHARLCAADALEEETAWMYVLESETLWVYDPETGHYNPRGEARAANILERRLGEHYSRSEKGEIIERLQDRNQTRRQDLNAERHEDPLLSVANGVVNIRTGDLLDHSPEFLFTRGVDHDWDPDAVPERTLRFLRSVTKRDEDMWTLLQQLGHGLMPGHPFKAFVVMFGAGDNGKSAVGKLFRRLVGDDNAASVELRDFREDDFATGDLPGKMINVGDDLSGKKLGDLSMLKRLSGGDSLRSNQKYEATYDFENEAAMFFSGNEPPVFAEQTPALKGRLYPIHMPYRFTQEDDEHADADPHLVDRIAGDSEEMSGLLALAVQGAQALIESGGRFALPEGPEERMQIYEAASDPIRRFVIDHLEQGEAGDTVLKDDAYRVFSSMCRAEDARSATKNTFKAEISQQALVDVEAGRTRKLTSGSDQQGCWTHLRFADSARDHMPARLRARYFGDEDESEDTDADEGDESGGSVVADSDAGELADLSPGFRTLEVTVAEILDAPDWLVSKGHVVDGEGNIAPFEVEGSEDPLADADEGDTVLLSNVKIEDRKGIPTLVLSGVTEARTTRSPAGDQSDLDAATDGGKAATDDVVPDDAEGTQADARRLSKWIQDTGGVKSKTEIQALAARKLDRHAPDRVADLISYAVDRGWLIKSDGGYRGDVV